MTMTGIDVAPLASAIGEARERYLSANPASAAHHHRAAAVMPGGNTRTVLHFDPFPLVFARGDGPHLWSLDGARYVDFLGEFTAGIFGHSEPTILRAVHAALGRGISFGATNDLEHELAELLCARFPSIELVRFTNSGTEANLMALALATHVTGRRRVLTFRGAYHGSLISFGDGPSPTNVPHEFVLGTYNDVEGTRALIRANGDQLAAVLVEPMLGAGGSIPGTSLFLRMLRAEAGACGAMLVFDEVMTSRLSPGGLQQLEQITPDLTTVGKYLAGGMSFGAFGGRRELMAHFDPSAPAALPHAGTFNNNVLSMSAGIAGLRDVLTDDALAELNARGDRLRADLNASAKVHDVALHVSGRGSLMTIHPATRGLIAAAELTAAQTLAKELIFFELLEAAQWTSRRGMLALSLPITDEHCAAFAAEFDAIVGRRADLLRTQLGPRGRSAMSAEKWITFDCYGTLVDWHRGYRDILRSVAGDRVDDLVAAYHLAEPQVEEQQPGATYRTVLHDAVERAAAAAGIPVTPDQLDLLARRWADLPVFPDTAPALRDLRADGWRLGVLTNCDNDLFESTRPGLGAPIDLVVTAEDVGNYKPDLAHFTEFERRSGVDRDDWVHAAVSWFHDMAPARALGIRRVWVDRDDTGQDPATVTRRVFDLPGLVAVTRDPEF